MGKVFNLGNKAIGTSDTPDLIGEFYEWGQRTNAVIDNEFTHQFADYLTLSAMDCEWEKPPSFILIGSRAATRAKLGDQWAQNIIKTQKPPITHMDRTTARGYVNALYYGFTYDLVDVRDDTIETTYRRLILPIRQRLHSTPVLFATLLFFDGFSQREKMPDGVDRQIWRRKSNILH